MEEEGSPVPPAPPVEDATRAEIRQSMNVNCSGEKWATLRTPFAAEPPEGPGSVDMLTRQAERKKISREPHKSN